MICGAAERRTLTEGRLSYAPISSLRVVACFEATSPWTWLSSYLILRQRSKTIPDKGGRVASGVDGGDSLCIPRANVAAARTQFLPSLLAQCFRDHLPSASAHRLATFIGDVRPSVGERQGPTGAASRDDRTGYGKG